MTSYTRSILYLGNRPEADTHEGYGNAAAENLETLGGKYTVSDGLSVKSTTLHDVTSPGYYDSYGCYHDGPNGVIEEDDVYDVHGNLIAHSTSDCVTYDHDGNAVTTQLDNVQGATAHITLEDGTVLCVDGLVLTQMTNGDVFLSEGQDCPHSLDCLKIVSIEIVHIDCESYSGWIIPPNIEHTCVICFADCAQIETDQGLVDVASLEVGQTVRTLDNGDQTIRWVGKRHLSAADLQANPRNRPIRIRAGALGQGLPETDLVVSPQHRVLVRSKIAQRMFGAPEVLTAAKQLLELDGVEVAEDLQEITYVHFFCDAHEIVYAHGLPTETLYPGKQTLKTLDPAAMEELYGIFPQLRDHEARFEPARPFVTGRRARKMVSRHIANGKVLVAA